MKTPATKTERLVACAEAMSDARKIVIEFEQDCRDPAARGLLEARLWHEIKQLQTIALRLMPGKKIRNPPVTAAKQRPGFPSAIRNSK